MNVYVITNKDLNPSFSDVAVNYTNMLKNIKDKIDFISVQFYNNSPSAIVDGEQSNVIKAYKDIVKDVFDGNSEKVVLGICNYADSDGGCANCTIANNCTGNNIVTNIINPLMDIKSNPNGFGGIMQWSTTGDQNGSFSIPISKALGY